jgi:hypothetical protein
MSRFQHGVLPLTSSRFSPIVLLMVADWTLAPGGGLLYCLYRSRLRTSYVSTAWKNAVLSFSIFQCTVLVKPNIEKQSVRKVKC